jgi:hypothetical protein
MLSLVSLLALALAAPGPAAPPLSPTADNDALYTEIAAGDPAVTAPAGPLERLVAATEIAEGRLREADDDDAEDLLTLAAQGRRAAYGRTGEALHLCRLIAAADVVLAREALPPRLKSAATDFQKTARDTVGAKCEDAVPRGGTDGPPPDGAVEAGAERAADPSPTVAGPAEPPTPRPVIPPARRLDRRHLRAGVGTLVPGLLLFAPMAGLLAYRGSAREELMGINGDTQLRPGTPLEDARAIALDNRIVAATAGAVALGVTGAALVVTGAVFLATGRRANRVAVAPWGGRGIGGLVLQGRF